MWSPDARSISVSIEPQVGILSCPTRLVFACRSGFSDSVISTGDQVGIAFNREEHCIGPSWGARCHPGPELVLAHEVGDLFACRLVDPRPAASVVLDEVHALRRVPLAIVKLEARASFAVAAC